MGISTKQSKVKFQIVYRIEFFTNRSVKKLVKTGSLAQIHIGLFAELFQFLAIYKKLPLLESKVFTTTTKQLNELDLMFSGSRF